MPWDVGDPIGTGDDIGAPEVPYMSYGPRPVESEEEIEERRRRQEEEERIQNLEFRSGRISNEAWILYEEGRYDEAIVFINRALELCERNASSWYRKAMILEKLNRYVEALHCYDKAVKIQPSETNKHNKATFLIDYSYHLYDIGNTREGIFKIKSAIDIYQEISDKRREDEAWNLRGIFLEIFGNIPEAFGCYKKALELAPSDSSMKQTYIENRDNLLQLIENTDINCPGCGEKLKITDSYCFKCGSPIDESVEIVLKNKN